MTPRSRWAAFRRAFTRAGLVALALPFSALGGDWTDRGEYDLALTIREEASPKQRLQLLDRWKARYPSTQMLQARRELYLSTYQSLGDNAGMLATAREMLISEPDNLIGLYWCTLLTPGSKDTGKANLDSGEKAAQALIGGLDRLFATSKKPPNMPPAAWEVQKTNASLLAHRTLGWVHWQRGEYPAAEQQFSEYLKVNPGGAEVSAWYGMVLGVEKAPDKQVPALWLLAHSVSLRGAGALDERKRGQISALLERLYVSYHGEPTGLDQLRTAAEATPFPPPDFRIEPAAEVAARKELEAIERANPQLAEWVRIRTQLEAAGGPQFFEKLKAAPLPKLAGILISATPPRRPDELVLGMRDPAVPDVRLRLSTPLAGEAAPGIPLEFEGMADSFSLSPFMLVITVDKSKLSGWPPARR